MRFSLSPSSVGGPRAVDTGDGFHVLGSRHLIAEQYLDESRFIPNDIAIPRSKKITIITGPNSSGKSVLMKQIGLNCVLNQLCGHTASEPKSSYPLIHQLFTRIRTVESSGRRQSSFAIELLQVKEAVEACEEARGDEGAGCLLLLVDEFGKGTQSEDGISLLVGLIEYVRALEHKPWTFLVTHFVEVADYLADAAKEDINWLQMDLVAAINEEPTFLFRAVAGVSERSLGMQCARIAGIDGQVLRDACDISAKLGAGISVRDLAWAEVPEEEETAMATLIKESFSL